MDYSDQTPMFERVLGSARRLTGDFKKVKVAVGAYKLTARPEIFKEQFEFCEESGCGTCVVFHYGSVSNDNALAQFLTQTQS